MRPPEKIKILFLYTEIAGYFLSSVKALLDTGNVEVHIVKWPVNKEAPFGFTINDSVKIYERNKFDDNTLFKLAMSINPHLIYCAGWMDKAYLKICKGKKNQIPTLLGFDNKWEGSVKQIMSLLYARITFLRFFSHCLVPGEPQVSFAHKMGFTSANILKGLYCADVPHFKKIYQQHKASKLSMFPKRFLYVGRYVKSKGIEDLWQAFIELHTEYANDWELWCIGTGPVKPVEHPKIKHLGFVQPEEIGKYLGDTGVFILPSIFEPWGVVVHEFAAAGFPLVCSDRVGASSLFLEEGANGYSFKAGNIHELKKAMKKIMDTPVEKLIKMAEKSVELSERLTPAKWADTLLAVINKQQ